LGRVQGADAAGGDRRSLCRLYETEVLCGAVIAKNAGVELR